jgi:hypothetical protein
MDTAGESLLYDEFRLHTAKENLIMNIEKRDLKMFNILAVVVLAAVLLTAVSGIMLQRQGLPAMGRDMRISRGDSLMQPESTQTSPTGSLVMNTGIVLLLVGFGLLVLILLVRRNWLHHTPLEFPKPTTKS